jgi:outer membrane protein assembly factor BamB
MKRKLLVTLFAGGILSLGFLAAGTTLIGGYKEQPNLIVLRSAERVFSDALFINSVAAAYAQETKSFYVLSALRKEVTVYNQAHKLSKSIAPFIQAADALAVDSQGRIYIADSTSNQIKILDPTGQLLRSFRAPRPTSLAVLSNGNIVVASPVGGKLLHLYDPSGHKLRSFGEVVRFDVANHAQNRFLNRGKVLVGPSDTIYYT